MGAQMRRRLLDDLVGVLLGPCGGQGVEVALPLDLVGGVAGPGGETGGRAEDVARQRGAGVGSRCTVDTEVAQSPGDGFPDPQHGRLEGFTGELGSDPRVGVEGVEDREREVPDRPVRVGVVGGVLGGRTDDGVGGIGEEIPTPATWW